MRVRKTSLAILSLGLAAGGATSIASPAAADWDSCSISYMCLWGGSNYDGGPWFEKKARDNYSTGWSNNDESSSVANRSSVSSFMLFARESQKTDEGVACVPRNYSEKRMGDYGWGDRVSSMRITSGACPDGVDYLGRYKTS